MGGDAVARRRACTYSPRNVAVRRRNTTRRASSRECVCSETNLPKRSGGEEEEGGVLVS